MMRATGLIMIAVLVAGCGGGGGDSGTGPAPVATVTLTPSTVDTLFAKSATTTLVAAALDASNNPVVGAVITFSTSNPAVATVASNGKVTAVGEGSTNITASSGGKTSAAVVVRVRQRYRKLVASPITLRAGVGDTATVTADPEDSLGSSIAGLVGTVFSSTDTSIATVDAGGIVTAKAVGSTLVIASLTRTSPDDGTFADTVAVTVITVPQDTTVNTVGLTFTPATVDVKAGGTVTFSNATATAHSVVWDTPGAPSGIGAWSNGTRVSTMNTKGTFNYHCGIHGLAMSGTIVVH